MTWDVVVVGGGILGLCLTRSLAAAGASVLLAERDMLGRGASGANAGSLHFQLRRQDTPLPFRAELIRRSMAAWQAMPDTVSDDMELHFHGGLMVGSTPDHAAALHAKIPADYEIGLSTRILDAHETAELVPGLSRGLSGVAFCPEEGAVNPLLAGPAVARAAERLGAEVRTGAPVRAIEPLAGGGFRVDVDGTPETARVVVNAGGPYAVPIGAMVGAPARHRPVSQMVSVLGRLPRLLLPMVQHIGARLTMKQTGTGTVLVGGGWLGDQTVPEATLPDTDAVTGNLALAAEVLPPLLSAPLLRTWAGLIPVTPDNLPVIGEHTGLPGFVEYVVPRGYAGYTFAPVLGEGLARQLTGQDPGIDLDPYDPNRPAVAGDLTAVQA
ncbi:FAD-dependent oxidoreductase [Nakamurella sp. YIM 132087]|uniref:FAD-dependent oxidoreductase n=1 Tax=Nakamurella alba TaxID=2665158 RepID=A0A7K1FSN7_9ACTN|nr:FAD-dependent oxidoreductase [Nakamurella alba]MTD17166.1 FAD-dependent oxidoreductase [Nakamurella alba]